MRLLRVLSATILLSAIFVSICLGLSMLPKSMFYLNSATNKTGEALYWSIYLGQPECSLDRKYPGSPCRRLPPASISTFYRTGISVAPGIPKKERSTARRS